MLNLSLAAVRLVFACVFGLIALSMAHAEPVTVRTEASGLSQREAIAEALILAVEQVSGLKLESNSNARKQFNSVADDTKQTVSLKEDVQQDIKQQSGGIVSSYEILSSQKNAEGRYDVSLSVTIEKFEAKGLANDNRRRIIVGAITSDKMEACTKTVSSNGIGTGLTRQDAINAALAEGVEKVTGMKIKRQSDPNAITATRQIDASASAEAQSSASANSASIAVVKNTRGQGAVAASQSEANAESSSAAFEEFHLTDTVRIGKAEILISSGGSVKTFDIVSVETDAKGQFVAQVTLEIAQCPSPQAFATRVVERLTSYLTRTRRFAVLDRAQDAAYAKEMDLIRSDNVPLKERVRIGQVLATDYIIVGKLNSFTSGTLSKTNALTGEKTSKEQFSTSIDFQVIDIATRQVKWSGTMKMAHANVEALAELSAQMIGEDITQTIYPLRAIKIDDPNAIVINQGGDTLKVGQIYKAYKLGEDLKDPYSKESLGRAEQEIATVKIMRVEAKMSYAAVQSGTMAQGDDVLLRRSRGTDASPAASAPPKAAVATPFD